jgi:hypothetical protein
MESLDRIVADSLARHGFEPPVNTRPIEWSRWFRCESSFSLLLVPSAPGLYAIAEEIVAPGELPGARRMLAVFEVGETDDLCVALSRQFAPRSPLSVRLSTGRCFVRFAQIPGAERRQAASDSLNRWLAASAQTATGLTNDVNALGDFKIAHDFTKPDAATRDCTAQSAVPSTQMQLSGLSTQSESKSGAPGDEPPPLPAGF